MIRKTLLAGLLALLSSAAFAADEYSVGYCVDGNAQNFKLMCYYSHTTSAYQTIDALGYRCMLNTQGTPAFYWQHQIYFEQHTFHSWSNNIAVGCNYNLWRWRSHYKVYWAASQPPALVGYRETQFNGQGPGCGPPQ